VSSIVQAKAEAQKLIKRYNQLQAEARTADAEEAARKATEAEKLVSQISALQTAISKLQARDKETKEKEAKDSAAAAPLLKKSTLTTVTTTAKKPETPEEALEDLKRAEAEKSALELRINRIETAQRRTREQIDQLARAKQELAKLKSQAEQSVKDRRANDEKLQDELTRRIEQKEREQQRLKDELEAARHKAQKDAELLKAQRDAARALIEKQQQLEREKLLATRRSSGSGRGILIGLSISVLSVVAFGATIWFTPVLDSIEIIARLKTPVQTNSPAVSARPTATAHQQPKEAPPTQTATVESKPAAVPHDPPRALEVYQDNLARGGLGPVMIKLSDGAFSMGAKASAPFQDELPPHEVRLQSFSISRFEITFEEFDAFAESTGLTLPKDKGWGRGKQPVINITWEEAVDYTKWLSQQTGHQYRLPSEREWEYAAGAGKDSLYWWGNELGRNRGNCAVCGSQWDNNQPAPVGSFQPNPLGLNDTIGNVLEWTVDCFRSNYIGAPVTGNLWQGGDEDCSRRMARSGSFRSYENALRTTKRNNYSPRTRLDNLGFRVVRVD
jgi:formylglycine-generating enzyme required for sulfatase activity